MKIGLNRKIIYYLILGINTLKYNIKMIRQFTIKLTFSCHSFSLKLHLVSLSCSTTGSHCYNSFNGSCSKL